MYVCWELDTVNQTLNRIERSHKKRVHVISQIHYQNNIDVFICMLYTCESPFTQKELLVTGKFEL